MKKYNTIIFDLDGTIIDPSVGIVHSLLYALDKMNTKAKGKDVLLKFIGPPLIDSFKKYFGFDDETAKQAIKHYRAHFKEEGVLACSLYEGVETVIKTLKGKGKRLLVATTKPEIHAIEVLEHFHLEPYFDFVAGSYLDGRRVDKGELIIHALESTGITELDKVMIIGDRKHDTVGAKTAGIDSMGILYGFGHLKELEDAGATYIAPSPGDILSFIE